MATTDFKDGITATALANNATVGPFTLLGGKYACYCTSSGTASVTLEVLAPDGSTYVACGSAVTTYSTFDLPAGTYKVVGGSAFGTGTVAVLRVPYKAG